MFYSEQLLSLRSRGKLSKCWLAATVSTQKFKRIFRNTTISGIDVCALCEEILMTIEVRQNRVYRRFSLYLSSQLMFGVARILSYQIIIFQNYLFEVMRKLELQESEIVPFDARRALEMILEPSGPSLDIHDRDLPQDLHTIREDPRAYDIEYMVREAECLNFGVLTNAEQDLLLSRTGELLSWEVERLRLSLPERDGNGKRLALSRIEKEAITQVNGSPRKRTLQSTTSPLLATPTKRSRLTLEHELEVQQLKFPIEPQISIEQEFPIEPQIPVEQEFPIEPQILVEQQFSIEPEIANGQRVTGEQQVENGEQVADGQQIANGQEVSEIVVERRQWARRKIFDRLTTLSTRQWTSQIRDVRVHTTEPTRPLPHFPTIQQLFTMPSISLQTIPWRNWSSKLFSLYKRHIKGPFTNALEFSSVHELQDTAYGETLRRESRDQLAEVSSRIEQLEMETTGHSMIKPSERTISELPAAMVLETLTESHQDVTVHLPEVTDMELEGEGCTEPVEKSLQEEKSYGSFLPMTKVDFSGESTRKGTPLRYVEGSSSSFERISITKAELVALAEILLKDNEYVRFQDLLPPDSYDRFDAACAFLHLLELHAAGKLILKQSSADDVIWIQKYPNYSSDSDIPIH